MVDSFETRLAEIIGKPSTQRPFVCDGMPERSEVWVVGYNAATTGGDWWHYWSSSNGFDYSAWRSDYDRERTSRGKGPSATRRRIDRLAAAIPHLLETNIYAEPSTNMANMPEGTKDAFDLLLANFSPKIIIAHGKPAIAHLDNWNSGLLIKCSHLSRAGYSEVDNIIAQVASQIKSATN